MAEENIQASASEASDDILKTVDSGDTDDILAQLDELTGGASSETKNHPSTTTNLASAPTSSSTSASGPADDILAELDELAGSSASEKTPKTSPAITKTEAVAETVTSSNTPAAPTSAPAPAPAPAPASTDNTWSWNSLASTLTGAAADVEAVVIEGDNADLGATRAEIQQMESAIASAEEAVSSAVFSAFSSVTETLGGGTTMTSTTKQKQKKTKKKDGIPVDDSDLDALTRDQAMAKTNDNDDVKPEASKSAESEVAAAAASASAGEKSGGGWTSWTESLARDLNSTTASILPNLPAAPPLDKDGKELVPPKQEKDEAHSATDTAAEVAAAASSSLWSAFSAVSDTLMHTASNDSNDHGSSTANAGSAVSSNMFVQLYTSKVNQAAEWIEDLEKDANSKDPYKHLRQHLDEYLVQHPTGSYEAWIQKWVQEQGWGEEEDEVTTQPAASSESAVTIIIDPSYYKEESYHRNFWNERNYHDGIEVDNPDAPRKYVAARGKAASAAGTKPM